MKGVLNDTGSRKGRNESIHSEGPERKGRVKTYFYADFYAILNFIMNLFLIMITAMFRQKRCRFCRFLILACLSAVVSVCYTYLFWERAVIQMGAAILQMGLFVFLAFEWEGVRTYAGDCAVFFFLTFFTGGFTGALQGFLQRIAAPGKNSAVWIFLAVVLLFLLFFLFRWELIRQEHFRKNIRTAKVFHGGKEARIRILYDTGNQLVSPYTGERVAVISQELAFKLDLEKGQNPLFIPYHSIGGNGLLKAYRMECIRIEGDGCKKEFLVAVSENMKEGQDVQMILNIM